MKYFRTLAMVAAARERENSVRGGVNEDSTTQKGAKRGRKSISVISPASVAKVRIWKLRVLLSAFLELLYFSNNISNL